MSLVWLTAGAAHLCFRVPHQAQEVLLWKAKWVAFLV
jgi:hypothetical protein